MIDFYTKSSLATIGFLIIIFFILFYRYKKILDTKIITKAYILLSLRFLSLVIILYLFINPLLIYENNSIVKPKVGIFVDNSKSMSIFQSFSNINYLDQIDTLVNYLENKNYLVKKFVFSDSLKKKKSLSDLKFNEIVTNFSPLSDLKSKYDLDYNIIISDGIPTVGKAIEGNTFKNPTFGISVGDSIQIIDVKLEKIFFKRLADNYDIVEILCIIKSKLNKQINTNLIITNENGDIIHNNFIKLNEGENLSNEKIIINSSFLTSENTVSIMKVKDEYNFKNNSKKFFFNNVENPKNILLISGVISTNTYLIKKNILIDKNNTLYHIYAFNKNDLDSKLKKIEFSNYDLIILDSFLDKKIFQYNNNVIFFEGPNMLDYQVDLISNIFDLERKINYNLQESHLINNKKEYLDKDLSSLPPFKRNFIYNADNSENILYKYNDNSDAIIINDNAIGFFVPNIGNVYKKIPEYDNKENINDLIKMIINYSKDDNRSIISFRKTHKYITLGESLDIGIKYSYLVEPRYINNKLNVIAYKDSIEKQLNLQYDQINNGYYVNFNPKDDGKWLIKGTFFYDDKKINIEPIEVYVEENDREDLFINDKSTSFKKLILKTGGDFVDIDKLTKSLTIFNFEDKEEKKVVSYESADIFKFLTILVIILCVEWYYRKQKGLL